METLAAFIFLLLVIALILSGYRKEKHVLKAKLVRFTIVIFSIAFYTYWFIQKSVEPSVSNSTAVQIINLLPQPVDFYLVKVGENKKDSTPTYNLNHMGKIRSEHYRIDYLKSENMKQYWIVGYLGKRNLVYFSQHALVNPNMDQIIEINNYINQSLKLSNFSGKLVEEKRAKDRRTSVTITLSILLIFLNVFDLFRRRSVKKH